MAYLIVRRPFFPSYDVQIGRKSGIESRPHDSESIHDESINRLKVDKDLIRISVNFISVYCMYSIHFPGVTNAHGSKRYNTLQPLTFNFFNANIIVIFN